MAGLPKGYREKVYAGVLGKIIGVYLGRPFEGWSSEAIELRLGEIRGYVHEELGQPLVVADDDISGTFTFVRALEDHPGGFDIEPAAIGDHWLNMIIEKRSILWWGGIGRSAEHTAFLNLQKGIKAPASGSMAECGEIMSQQIGAQIFIDGWGLLCPGEPDRASDLARRAASVSHDGEAIHGAQSVAAMAAAAFNEPDPNRLVDIAMEQIPADSLLHQMVDDVREWTQIDQDWRSTFRRIQGKWGYDQWKGGCHMLPNHALVILALLNGGGSFDESMMIVNTAGWDTDCNSGNVGCILGVAGGLEPLEAWRGPVADRILLPAADGGRVITDAAREADAIVALARKIRGEEPDRPRPRFHFSLPGSVQGFQAPAGSEAEVRPGEKGLVLRSAHAQARVFTPTWTPLDARKPGGYSVEASPTLYPGQVVTAVVSVPSDQPPVTACLCLEAILDGESPTFLAAKDQRIMPGETRELVWALDLFERGLITDIGLQFGPGEIILHSMNWTGCPKVCLNCFAEGSTWKRQFVPAAEDLSPWGRSLSFGQSRGTGLLMTGTREWTDYLARTRGSSPLCREFGLAARVRGMRRWIAAIASRAGSAQIVRQWDDQRTVLAEAPLEWSLGQELDFSLQVTGSVLSASVGGVRLEAEDSLAPSGGIALLVTEGCADFVGARIDPPAPQNV